MMMDRTTGIWYFVQKTWLRFFFLLSAAAVCMTDDGQSGIYGTFSCVVCFFVFRALSLSLDWERVGWKKCFGCVCAASREKTIKKSLWSLYLVLHSVVQRVKGGTVGRVLSASTLTGSKDHDKGGRGQEFFFWWCKSSIVSWNEYYHFFLRKKTGKTQTNNAYLDDILWCVSWFSVLLVAPSWHFNPGDSKKEKSSDEKKRKDSHECEWVCLCESVKRNKCVFAPVRTSMLNLLIPSLKEASERPFGLLLTHCSPRQAVRWYFMFCLVFAWLGKRKKTCSA